MCQKILETRINDGLLGPATIASDVCTFEPSAEAKRKVKVMTAGFPCQVSCLNLIRSSLKLKPFGIYVHLLCLERSGGE